MEHICPDCGFTAKSGGGLSLHRRRKHATEYHREVEARASGVTRTNWSKEEISRLAKIEAELCCKDLLVPQRANQQLSEVFPERTLQGIKGKRRTEVYKNLVVEWTERLRALEVASDVENPGTPMVDIAVEVATVSALVSSISLPPDATEDPFFRKFPDLLAGFRELSELSGEYTFRVYGPLATRLSESYGDALMSSELRPAQRRRNGRAPGQERAHTHPPIANPQSSRAVRREQYKRLQALLSVNRSRAADHVLTGKWKNIRDPEVNKREIFDFWKAIFEAEQLVDERPVAPTLVHWILMKPVTVDEVKDAVKATRESAPGPDGATLLDVKTMNPAHLARLYNLWQLGGSVPDSMRKCKTTLIPKVSGEIVGPHERRPISVSSHYYRTIAKIMASRLRCECQVNPRQKAFEPIDGCQENLAILQAVLNEAHMLRSEVHLAFLDVAKAFDSVSWATIRRALTRVGVPDHMIQWVLSSYEGATSALVADGIPLGEVQLTRGVNQGDPLSPILFNLVLDEVLEALGREAVGVNIGTCKINAIAFADDLVIIAETAQGLQNLVDTTIDIMAKGGLEVNPGKCRSLSLGLNRGAKQWFVRQESRTYCASTPIGVVGPEDSYKYLGILIGGDGKRASFGKILEDGIVEIAQAHLKPQQRLSILVNHLLPKLTHRLVLGKVYRTQLDRLDVRIRVAVRSFLKLPRDCPDSMIYARKADGGLSVPQLKVSILSLKQCRLEKLYTSEYPIVRESTTSEVIQCDVRYWSGPIRVNGESCSTKALCTAARKRALTNTVDGRGIALQASESPRANDWLSEAESRMSGRDFVAALAVRCGTLPTPLRRSRGRPENTRLCGLCRVPASLGHISQVCPAVHGARVKRHDDILRFVAGRCRQNGYTVLEEPRLRFATTFRKPDLVLWRDGQAYILDVQVTSDQFPLVGPHMNKVSKYDHPEIISQVQALSGCADVEVSSVTISWRGCWSVHSSKMLERLGLSCTNLRIAVIKTLTWTHTIFKLWGKHGGTAMHGEG